MLATKNLLSNLHGGRRALLVATCETKQIQWARARISEDKTLCDTSEAALESFANELFYPFLVSRASDVLNITKETLCRAHLVESLSPDLGPKDCIQPPPPGLINNAIAREQP